MKETWDAYIVVDDNRFDVLIGTKIMEMIFPSMHGLEFTTGREMLDFAKADSFGDQRFLVLLDLNMPEMSGFEFLDHFRMFSDRVKAHFDILIISSSTLESDRDKSLAYSEVKGFYQKPLLVHQMKDALKELFGVNV